MAIQGNLPFGGGGAGAMAGPGGLQAAYASAYNSALDMNKANYQNILGGYQQLTAAQEADQRVITPGYAELMNGVLTGIDSIGGSQRQAIADQYAKASGAATQQLINSGLSNSTVASSVQRGLTLDRAKAENDLADRLAGTKAGYQAQLGQAGLSYQERALADRTGLGLQQLGWMNTVSAPYPDAGQYQQLAALYGQMEASKGGGGAGGGVGAGVPGVGGTVTKGGHQFAPNSSIDWNAGATPPVQGAGSSLAYVRDPTGGQGTAAIRQGLGLGAAAGGAGLASAFGQAQGGTPPVSYDQMYGLTDDQQLAANQFADAGALAQAFGSNLVGDFY